MFLILILVRWDVGVCFGVWVCVFDTYFGAFGYGCVFHTYFVFLIPILVRWEMGMYFGICVFLILILVCWDVGVFFFLYLFWCVGMWRVFYTYFGALGV